MVTQIEKMLVEAWEKFCDYYDTKAPRYRDSWRPKLKKEKDAKDSHWICWNESDLMVHLGRYFYRQRDKKSVSDKELLNIEMHFDKNLNYYNFKDYPFEDKLWRAHDDSKRKLEVLLNDSRKYPKLDLIITWENKFGPFLLCAEAKHFHASVRNGPIEKEIEKDIRTLAAIKKSGITKNIAYIIFDDYYYLRKRSKKDVEKIVDDIIKKKGIEKNKDITVLFHTSEAKMCGFRPDC